MLHRLNVVLPPPERIINARNQQHAPKHDARPVHVFDRRGIDDGEEAGDARDRDVQHGESVDGDGGFAERETGGWERFAAGAFEEDAIGKGVSFHGHVRFWTRCWVKEVGLEEEHDVTYQEIDRA